MALQTKFVGKSASGDLTEAIQNALKKARKKHTPNKGWVIEKIAQNQLTFPPLSVLILVGGGKGEGGIGPR
jgi:hypothetical protein